VKKPLSLRKQCDQQDREGARGGFLDVCGVRVRTRSSSSTQAFLGDERSQGCVPGGLIQPKTLPSSRSISPRCQISVPRSDPNPCVPVELPGVGLSCKPSSLDWGGRCLRWEKNTAFLPLFRDARGLAGHKMTQLNPTLLKSLSSVPLPGPDL